LGALVGIEYFGLTKASRLLAEAGVYGVRESPGQFKAAVQVDDGHQVGETAGHRDIRDIRDIRRPEPIRPTYGQFL